MEDKLLPIARCENVPRWFIRLRLHYSLALAKRTRVLLSQNFGDKLTDLLLFPHSKQKFQLSVSVSAFGDLAQEQAANITAEHST